MTNRYYWTAVSLPTHSDLSLTVPPPCCYCGKDEGIKYKVFKVPYAVGKVRMSRKFGPTEVPVSQRVVTLRLPFCDAHQSCPKQLQILSRAALVSAVLVGIGLIAPWLYLTLRVGPNMDSCIVGTVVVGLPLSSIAGFFAYSLIYWVGHLVIGRSSAEIGDFVTSIPGASIKDNPLRTKGLFGIEAHVSLTRCLAESVGGFTERHLSLGFTSPDTTQRFLETHPGAKAVGSRPSVRLSGQDQVEKGKAKNQGMETKSKICPKCNEVNPASARHCVCGARLDT